MRDEQLIERIMKDLRCSRAYAVEYLMERRYNQMSHGQAVNEVNEKFRQTIVDSFLSTDNKGGHK